MNYVQPIRDVEKIESIKQYFRIRNERNYVLFLTGINTGLRISDILRLQVNDVQGTYIRLREKKTKKQKMIRITPELRKAYKSFTEQKQGDEYLFKSRQGVNQPIDRSTAYKILAKAAAEFHLKDIGTHTLRKTFGYHFYAQNKNVALLQDIFNHASPDVTLRYIGINQDNMDKAMVKFKI